LSKGNDTQTDNVITITDKEADDRRTDIGKQLNDNKIFAIMPLLRRIELVISSAKVN